MKTTILISACAAGIRSAYNGQLSKRQLSQYWQTSTSAHFIPFCPEQIAGFSTPRPPVEIIGGDGFDVLSGHAQVVTCDGLDVTDVFLKSLDDIQTMVHWVQPSLIVLQERSPSCSCTRIYNGTFSRTLIQGYGVVAAFCKQNGYALIDISTFNKKKACTQESVMPLI